jgi:hypothetical protein
MGIHRFLRRNRGGPFLDAIGEALDCNRASILLFDDAGHRMVPTHATKAGVRYRYYVSRRLIEDNSGDPTGWRLPALAARGGVQL